MAASTDLFAMAVPFSERTPRGITGARSCDHMPRKPGSRISRDPLGATTVPSAIFMVSPDA
jgi:hypothetical protein